MARIGERRLKDSFCSYCGMPQKAESYPKKCDQCGEESYLNAPAVGIGLIPINGKLLIIQRNISPCIGGWALPGGYKNLNETWKRGIVREVFEETGIMADEARIEHAATLDANNGAVLNFGVSENLIMDPVVFNIDPVETMAVKLISEPEPLCFPHHQTMMEWYFAQ